MKTFTASGIELERLIPGSKYFTWKEALWLESMQAYALPDPFTIKNIQRQAIQLDRVRNYFGSPVIVTSWLRPPKYNSLIGGAPNSWHVKGLATDFTVMHVSIDEVKRRLQAEGARVYEGRGEIHNGNWCHLDLGGTVWFRP